MTKLLLSIVAGLCIWGCQTKQVTERETTIYYTLRQAAQQQHKDAIFFTQKPPSDSLGLVYQQVIAKASVIDEALTMLNDTLIQQAGKGIDPHTKAPQQAYEIKHTHQILQQQLPAIDQQLRGFNTFLKTKAQDVPIPDLKTYAPPLYAHYFEEAHLMQCLHMLQQIRNDVWFNTNLVNQRLSY